VALDDLLHGRQADAGSLELISRVKPLEHAEQLAGIRHIEAGAVIAHEIHRGLACIPNSMRPTGRRPVNFQALPFERS
jgi:hypothetical protein